MKLKLDENLGKRAQEFLIAAGFDASTVAEQKLCGCEDERLIDVCSAEGRCLLTLDLDFSNPIAFPPEKYAGIIVLRLPRDPSFQDILDCVNTFVLAVPSDSSMHGKLRIVSKGRIREYSRDR